MSDTVNEHADRIMSAIHEDMKQPFPWGKQIPRDVGSFSALHDYCDANEYFLSEMPYHGEDEAAWNAYMELCNAVSDEVDRRLRIEAGLTTDVWVATGPGVMVGSVQLLHVWSTVEKAMAECERIARRPLDWQEDFGGRRFKAEGRKTPSGAFSGPYIIVRQTVDATDAQTYPLF